MQSSGEDDISKILFVTDKNCYCLNVVLECQGNISTFSINFVQEYWYITSSRLKTKISEPSWCGGASSGWSVDAAEHPLVGSQILDWQDICTPSVVLFPSVRSSFYRKYKDKNRKFRKIEIEIDFRLTLKKLVVTKKVWSLKGKNLHHKITEYRAF